MNETFLFILLAAICALAGAFLGNLFARLKNKARTGKLEERLEQSGIQFEKLEERFTAALNGRDEIRKEKELLNAELVRRNS
ncbi:MAG: DNA recombination protein RmuC, partial [Marinirhabdus sp.]